MFKFLILTSPSDEYLLKILNEGKVIIIKSLDEDYDGAYLATTEVIKKYHIFLALSRE